MGPGAKTRWWVGLTLVAVGAVGLWLALRGEAPEQSAEAPEARSEAPTPPAASPPVDRRQVAARQRAKVAKDAVERWTPGVRRVYAVEYLQQVRLGDPGGEVVRIEVRVGGRWAVTVTDVEREESGGVVHLAAQLEVEVYDARSGQERTSASEVEGLEALHFVTLRLDGGYEGMRVPADADAEGVRILRALAQGFQRSEAQAAEAGRWEVEERDAMGLYRATYIMKEDEPAPEDPLVVRVVTRTKGAYLEGERESLPPPKGVTQTARFELAESGWPRGATVQQAVERPGEAGFPAVASREEAWLTLVALERAPELVGAYAEGAKDMRPVDQLLAEAAREAELAQRRAQRERLLEGVTLPAMLAALDEMGPGNETAGEQVKVMRKLRHLFEQDPAAARAMVDAIKGGLVDWQARVGIGALSAAESPVAYQGLVDLLGWAEAGDASLRRSIAIALGMSTEASVAGLDALKSAAAAKDTGWGTSLMAAGSTAERLARSEPEVVEAFIDELSTQAKARPPDDEEHLPAMLSALGNAAQPEGLPVILDGLESTSEWVRASAVYALRGYPGAEIDALLVEHLRQDPALRVRRRAVSAIGDRGPQPFVAALQQALTQDPAPDLRMAVLNLVAGRPEMLAALKPTLQALAAGEGDEGVKAKAAQLLAGS